MITWDSGNQAGGYIQSVSQSVSQSENQSVSQSVRSEGGGGFNIEI